MECSGNFYLHNFKFIKSDHFDDSFLKNGISIYEVIRIENGVPLFLENHLNRLYKSSEISNFSINESYCDFETLTGELITKNNILRGKIKIIVQFNTVNGDKEKNLLIYFTPHYFPTSEECKKGVKTGFCKAIRLNPQVKILNSEARIRANDTIAEKKLFEVILQDNDGFITEGSRSNVFFIKDDELITPPESDVLQGITRLNIIRLCKSENIKLKEKKIHISEISEMDSAFLSGTSLKILPVNNIDSFEFYTQNQVLQKISGLYNKSIEDYINERST
ncbi:MAG: aminotransferase class IV [Bacteroidales bacterium]|nr:aminotransferase class IV [Bacteroidales bacterium]